jgi:hypothetical protein
MFLGFTLLSSAGTETTKKSLYEGRRVDIRVRMQILKPLL